MKNGKNPTKAQKIFLKERGLNPDDWLISKNTSTEMRLIHRCARDTRVITKDRKDDDA